MVMKKIIAQNSMLNLFKNLINFSKESIIFNMSFLLICDAPDFWQLQLQDPASSNMKGILFFNKHLLFIVVVLVILTGWLFFNTIYSSHECSSSKKTFSTDTLTISTMFSGVSTLVGTVGTLHKRHNFNTRPFYLRRAFHSSIYHKKSPELVVTASVVQDIAGGSVGIVPFVKTLALAGAKDLIKPKLWLIGILGGAFVFTTALGYSSYCHISEINSIVKQYNHILVDPALLKELAKIDLSTFNVSSATRISELTFGYLDQGRCELIVRFCVHEKIHIFKEVLIDCQNGPNFPN